MLLKTRYTRAGQTFEVPVLLSAHYQDWRMVSGLGGCTLAVSRAYADPTAAASGSVCVADPTSCFGCCRLSAIMVVGLLGYFGGGGGGSVTAVIFVRRAVIEGKYMVARGAAPAPGAEQRYPSHDPSMSDM